MVAKHDDHVDFLSSPVVFLELFQAGRNPRKSLMSLKCPVHREETMMHNEEKARRISTYHPHCSVHPTEPVESPDSCKSPSYEGSSQVHLQAPGALASESRISQQSPAAN